MTTVLMTTAVKTTLVLVVTLAVAAAARHRSAAVRHWVLTVGLTSALAVPLLSALWPSFLTAPLTNGVMSTDRPANAEPAAAPLQGPRGGITTRVTVATATPAAPPAAWRIGGARLVASIWALGAALALSRLGRGLLTLRRLARGASPVVDGPWRTACDAAARGTGRARPVRLMRSASATPVVTWGWWRPTILIPADAMTWSAERRDIALAHEFAHIVRGDWVAQLVGEAVRALHWYQPLAWIANHQLRLDAERAADDRVVACGIDGVSYASHLLAFAQQARDRAPWTPAPAIARPSSLEGRISAMLDTSIDRTPLNRRSRIRIAAIAFAALLPLAALTTAQARFHTLSGTLLDSTGRVLPNVAVSLTSETTTAKYEVRSDASGRYRFVGLPPATYTLSTAALGFRPRSESVTIAGDRDLPLQIAVATLQESVRVLSTPQPAAAEDPVAAEQRRVRNDERSTQAAARQARAVATCAAGPPTAAGGNILPPWKIRHVNPTYPEQARAAGLGGTVSLRAVIDTTGSVRDVRQVVGPSADLEAAAVEAVREWRFTQTLLNCEAIEVEMDVRVDFATQQ